MKSTIFLTLGVLLLAGASLVGCGPSNKVSDRATAIGATTSGTSPGGGGTGGGGTGGGASGGGGGGVAGDDHGNGPADATPMPLQPATALSGPSAARRGAINFAGDQDWFVVDLEAGKTYSFLTSPQSSSGSSVPPPDTALELQGPNGQLLMSNDDRSSTDVTSEIPVYAARFSGPHFVIVTASFKASNPSPAYEVVVLQTSP